MFEHFREILDLTWAIYESKRGVLSVFIRARRGHAHYPV